MKLIRNATEAEMILEFLNGELSSKRFNKELNHAILELNLSTSIILDGDITNEDENRSRLNIMKVFRGYPDKELFNNFPKIKEWKYIELCAEDIDNIYYIDYNYYNDLIKSLF